MINKTDSVQRIPPWIRIKPQTGCGRERVSGIISRLSLSTVCQSARCPNLNECWHRQTAAFMILGNICTRKCRFCSVRKGSPLPADPSEAENLALAVKELKLKYVVITSVTRDDLDDGGASAFADAIEKVREINGKEMKIEVLTPDFKCSRKSLETVLAATPTVFNHNIETVRRLTPEIRSIATYENSLHVLKQAYEITRGETPVKSGLMAGLGESDTEIEEAITDIRRTGATLLTIGQYLPPEKKSWPVQRYVRPEQFERWRAYAIKAGFTNVASAPLVRSSYCADSLSAN